MKAELRGCGLKMMSRLTERGSETLVVVLRDEVGLRFRWRGTTSAVSGEGPPGLSKDDKRGHALRCRREPIRPDHRRGMGWTSS